MPGRGNRIDYTPVQRTVGANSQLYTHKGDYANFLEKKAQREESEAQTPVMAGRALKHTACMKRNLMS